MTADGHTDAKIRSILNRSKVIAMVGASAKPDRPSYGVMQFLLARGYTVHPVNPGLVGGAIQGQTVYARLADVPAPVDVVDIFRTPDAALGIVEQAIAEKNRLGIKIVWMQLGVINEEAAERGRAAGLTVVMDRCPKIEIGRLAQEPTERPPRRKTKPPKPEPDG